MIGALDVEYRDDCVVVALVCAPSWDRDDSLVETVLRVTDIQPADYEPGAFYKKELPYLLRIIEHAGVPLETIIVDSYVWLGVDHPGLGKRLSDALGGRVPVVGIAKTHFAGSDYVARELHRGASKRPLFITAEGMDEDDAVAKVKSMPGEHRLPTIVSRANSLSRTSHR